MAALTFRLSDKLYLRDPQDTDLGRRIIKHSIALIDQLGFEHFTFRKLADEIASAEASVYRYFENKHRLLHYLAAWYWNWLDYRIELATSSIEDPSERLRSSIKVITEPRKADPSFEFVNEEALHRIVIAEIEKTYLTKWVDNDNHDGFFGGFKALCKKVAGQMIDINPSYAYSHSLASTILLASHQQLFFVDHLPSLTDLHSEENNEIRHAKLRGFVESVVFGSLQR